MNPRCAAAIAQAALKLGKKVNKEYLRNIEAKVRETSAGIRMKDPAAWRAMDNETRMALVGTELAKEIQHQSARKATNAARDAVTHARNVDIVSAASSKGMTGNEGIQHIIGFIPDGKGGYINAESRAKALEQQHYIHLQPLIDLEKKGKLFGLLTDKEQMLDIVKEVRGERTGNADAKIVADAINKTNESVLTEYNSFGGDIRQLKNYLAQAQDQWRVYRAGKDKWVADAMQHIDRSTLMDSNGVPLSDAKAIEFLNEAWWNKASDGIGKDKVASGQFGGNQAIANRHRKHRVLHWKSADSWMYMQEHYGGGTLIDQISSHVKSMSEETVLMELFGSNPLHAIDLLKEVAEKSDKANGVNPAKTTAQANRLDKMVDSLAGINQGITGNIGVHKFFTGLRNLAVFDKLGGIITSQIADNGTAIATARVLNIPVSDWAGMKARGYTDASVKRMANANAIGFQVHLDNLSRLSEGTDNTGITGKMAAFTMKYSMANMTTQNHRRSFAALVESHLGSLSREFDWNTLPAADKKLLEGKGFTQKDWSIMRSATPDAETGLLGLQQINEVSADTIRKLIPDEIANIHSTAADIIDRLSSQNTKDAERLQGRQTKFAEYKDKIQKLIDEYQLTRSKKTSELGEEIGARIDVLKAVRDETDARIAVLTGDISKGVELGANVQKAVDAIREAKMRLSKVERKADKEIFAKATEFENRIDKRMNELEELTKSLDDKSTERNKLASEYEARIGKQEEKAIELARRDTALKITAMAIEEAEMAVLQPNLHSKSMLKLHKGEIVSEIGASFFQFKSFAVAMVNQHMMQRASMLDGKLSQAAYRLELLALTSVFGGMGLLMNDLISGKDPREVFDSEDPWVMAKFGKQAILKGGGLSIYGDMLNAVTGENRSNLAESLAGPTLGTFAKTGTLINEAYKEASGKGGNPSFHALKLANEFAMVDSMIWTRAAWNNYLMAELNEMASPGYMSRSRRAADKNYGTEYFAGMGTGLRAPNIANIYEQ